MEKEDDFRFFQGLFNGLIISLCLWLQILGLARYLMRQ